MYLLMDTMILFTLIFLTNIVEMRLQPATCNDDVHCSVGFFCHTTTHSCHECISCDHLRRRPGPDKYDCIKSDHQCGPCLEGLIENSNWGDRCQSPESKFNMKTLHMYILVSCVATSVLISIFIIHNIWNTNIVKVNIAYMKNSSPVTDSDRFIAKKNSMAFTA